MADRKIMSIYAIFPKRCVFCGGLTSPYRDCCERCEGDISRVILPVCPLCGREKEFCSCRSHSKFYDRLAAPFYFEGAVRRGIHRFKFRGVKRSAEYFARQMCDTFSREYADIDFDYCACIPSSGQSMSERGYNQSELLAIAVSEHFGIRFCGGMLVKLYETSSQHSIGVIRRKGNLTGVFDVAPQFDVTDKKILLIDDVATSGETLDECAKMLYLHGAQSTCCLTLAVTKDKIKKS